MNNDIVSNVSSVITGQDTALVAVLNDKMTKDLGLSEKDIPAIREIANRIEVNNPLSVAEFGREVSEHTARYADSILDQVRNRDLDDAGAKLSQVVVMARGLNMNALTDRRSKIPVVGFLIDKIRLKADTFKAEFETTKTQIDTLVGEVDVSQKGLVARNTALQDMFESVKEEHYLLGLHIAAGKFRLHELQQQVTDMSNVVNSSTDAQELADLNALVANLDKRIGDLQVLQQSALQSLPTIRLIQENNKLLVDKFYTIKEITIPAWKRQFLLAISLNEQRNAVQLANQIDNTTNEMMIRSAELLHTNSVDAAKSNQRLVIDVETLNKVQNSLIQTVEDVLKIQRDGVAQRQKAEQDILKMRETLKSKLTSKVLENGGSTSKEVA